MPAHQAQQNTANTGVVTSPECGTCAGQRRSNAEIQTQTPALAPDDYVDDSLNMHYVNSVSSVTTGSSCCGIDSWAHQTIIPLLCPYSLGLPEASHGVSLSHLQPISIIVPVAARKNDRESHAACCYAVGGWRRPAAGGLCRRGSRLPRAQCECVDQAVVMMMCFTYAVAAAAGGCRTPDTVCVCVCKVSHYPTPYQHKPCAMAAAANSWLFPSCNSTLSNQQQQLLVTATATPLCSYSL